MLDAGVDIAAIKRRHVGLNTRCDRLRLVSRPVQPPSHYNTRQRKVTGKSEVSANHGNVPWLFESSYGSHTLANRS